MKVKVKFSDKNTQGNLSLILNEIDYFGIKSAENYTSVCEALDKLKVTKVEHGNKVTDISDYFIPNQEHAKDITFKSINITGEKEGVTKNVSFIYAGFKN